MILTLPDLAGSNVVHKLLDLVVAAGDTTTKRAKMLLFRELTGGTTNSRLGGPNVGAGRGVPFSTSDAVVLPELLTSLRYAEAGWDLAEVYLYAATGDTIAIAYVPF